MATNKGSIKDQSEIRKVVLATIMSINRSVCGPNTFSLSACLWIVRSVLDSRNTAQDDEM